VNSWVITYYFRNFIDGTEVKNITKTNKKQKKTRNLFASKEEKIYEKIINT
jgi:hypothetical protein